jgi:hypothetical protein
VQISTYDGEIDVTGVQLEVDLLVEGQFDVLVEVLTTSGVGCHFVLRFVVESINTEGFFSEFVIAVVCSLTGDAIQLALRDGCSAFIGFLVSRALIGARLHTSERSLA